MTKFVRSEFDYHGGYLTYGPSRKFVARFKYCGRDKPGFVSFLIKNFTVEEYFDLYNEGRGLAPAAILKTRGYVSKTVQNLLVQTGYPTTIEGFDAYLANQVYKTMQRLNPTI